MGYNRSKAYGGPGGIDYADNLTEMKRLVGVRVMPGRWIDSITFTWEKMDGTLVSTRHGGSGGDPKKALSFELNQGEFITAVSGEYGDYINELVFATNRGNSHAVSGTDKADKKFSFGGNGYASTGLVGRADWYLDAIGFFSQQG